MLKNDPAQADELPAESEAPVIEEQSADSLVDWAKGKALCMDSEDFYREILQIFVDSQYDMELR